MNKSLLLASLIAVAALAACGKKEEAPAAAPASEASK
jgi:nitrous oxide reductase accessory protein NosL